MREDMVLAESPAKHAGGRPSRYDPQIAAKLCERLALGESIVKIAPELGVGLSSIYRWQIDNEEFRAAYARAREDQADTMADQIIEIADNTEEDSNSRRVRVDARKWVASKLKPKTYGDKTQLEHSGAIAAGPTDPEQVAQQFITMGTQYPTLNPLIRKMAEDILAKLPEIT